ncbi:MULTISPECIES: acyltransferase family protein [Methylosinus]|uniref:Acyltransferase n=1 Tax=Methylosinus trichosporium (strain ATCC 35070 / NCIMB 11131 / UNIQEM 75 / OB3b) TaxID=595536 RepID=A0A2D2D396_METT3|nr:MULTISPECIES: acyltransferase family protein [Methylosinus]ATQ69444.1 acyltransferase [Methylosinus trichosporium OB3b]
MDHDRLDMNHRPEIDGLRAAAVIAVIINHFDHSMLPSGYLGVDIFFVISGYVITMSIALQSKSGLGDFLSSFYTRRIKRLAPALILFVLAMSLATVALEPAPRESLNTGIAALFGVSNLYLLQQATDYFGSAIEENSFVHTWSLGVEEQIYLIYPFCVWFSGRGRGARIAPKAILGLAIVSLIAFVVLYRIDRPVAYFLAPTRFWEFSAGALMFFFRDSARLERFIQRIPTGMMAAAMLLALLAPPRAAIPATIAVVLSTAGLIRGFCPGTFTYAIFSRREIVYVGLISYSLYLWHWGVFWLARETIGADGWAAAVQFALIFLIAGMSHHYIERPLRRSEWSRWRSASIGYGVVASIAACALLVVLAGPFGRDLYLGRILGLPAPEHLQKTWWRDWETGKYIEKCHVENIFRAEYVGECLAIRDGERKHAFLVGDSFARNYLSALRGAFVDHEIHYLTMGYGCAFVPPKLADERSFVNCPNYVEASYRYLTEQVRANDIVFIGQSLWDHKRQTPQYFEFIKSFATAINEKRASVVLLDSTVSPAKRPEKCLITPWRPVEPRTCALTRSAVVAAYKEFDRLALDAAREVPNFYYAPLRTGLCRDDRCGQTTTGGAPIWHDTGHITEEASLELAPLLRRALENQGFFERQAGLQ